MGVQIKLINRFAEKNLRLEKLLSNFFMGMLRNRPNSMIIKNGTIKCLAYTSITFHCPKSNPRITASPMINDWYLLMTFNV